VVYFHPRPLLAGLLVAIESCVQITGILSQNKRTMNYLYIPDYVAERQYIYRDLYEAIGNENRLAMFKDIKGLSDRLKNFDNPEIITFLGVKWTDLLEIISIKELFLDAALIVLLYDDDQETLDKAISLRPKFVGTMSEDLDKVTPIIKKLVQKRRPTWSR
jgi:hypothetical protein